MIKNLIKKIIPGKIRRMVAERLPRLLSPIYYGDNFYCNCCNKKFRKFLVKGHVPRLNAQCPFCSSLERTRVLDLYLQKEHNLYQAENIKVLHFAPEYALFRKMVTNKNIIYIDADINPLNARNVIDITHIPFPDEHFDYIICSHVLGHVPDEVMAIKEMHRVLKPEGIAMVLTLLSDKDKTIEDKSITSEEARLKTYGEHDLCRLHGNDFAERLSARGFTVEKIDYRLSFSEEILKRQALGNGQREIIFKCTRNK